MIKLILAGPIRLIIFLLLTVFLSGCMTPQELEAVRAAKVTTTANTESNGLYDISHAPSCESGQPCFDDIADDPCKIFSSKKYCDQYAPYIHARVYLTPGYGADATMSMVDFLTAVAPKDFLAMPNNNNPAGFQSYYVLQQKIHDIIERNGAWEDRPPDTRIKNLYHYCWQPIYFDDEETPATNDRQQHYRKLNNTKLVRFYKKRNGETICNSEYDSYQQYDEFDPQRDDRLVIVREEIAVYCPTQPPQQSDSANVTWSESVCVNFSSVNPNENELISEDAPVWKVSLQCLEDAKTRRSPSRHELVTWSDVKAMPLTNADPYCESILILLGNALTANESPDA